MKGMDRFRISNANETANVEVICHGNQNMCYMHMDFLPLEQPRFVDAVDREYLMEEISKDGKGGATITFRCTREQKQTLIEDVAALLEENYVM